MYEYELANACLKLLRDMFQLQPGESIAISCDTESNMEVVEATAQAAVILGAKPLVVKMAAPRDCGKAGDIDMP
ncbi:MAG: aminopeptidase, partial [Oscillospiraceae bacterium]